MPTPASAFTNRDASRYEREFDLKDSQTRPVFEPAEKCERTFCRCQSLAMALYVRECHINPNVEWLLDEPGVIEFVYEGRARRHYPDLKLGLTGQREKIVEVKSSRYRYDEELKAMFRAVAAECNKAGFEFELVFSHRVYREPKRSNVGLIHYYRQTPLIQQDLDDVSAYFADVPQATIGSTIAACSGMTLPKLCALIAKGLVWVNLFKPVNFDAPIRLPRQYA